VGWHWSDSWEAKGPLTAFEMGLTARKPPAWIHPSDRGVQDACQEYVQQVQAAGARISITAVGEPKQNAPTERCMRTLKEEEVERQEYRTLVEAK